MIVYSCWQDEWSSNVTDEVIFDSNKELTIAKAEQWYNATNPSATTVRSLSADGRIPAKPNWNKAKESKKGDLEVVETTLMTSGSTFFMDNETKEKYELQDDLDKIYNVARMVTLKNLETGEIYNFIMVFIGTYDYLMHTTLPEKGEYFVILSDGTKVWINSDSELEFPNRFGGDIREVKLKGEAYFEVTSDSRKPFYVLAGETKVHVLGTAFNVSAYREDRQTEVALLRGKVSFDVKDKVYVLVPGEIATLNRESGETIVRKGDVAAIVDWKAGRFNFEDMSLEELTVKLSRWYGVTFVFSDEAVKKLRFSGAMTKYRTLDYVLDMISKTTDVTFSLKENRVTVSSKK